VDGIEARNVWRLGDSPTLEVGLSEPVPAESTDQEQPAKENGAARALGGQISLIAERLELVRRGKVSANSKSATLVRA
jgi:hypothetical protein